MISVDVVPLSVVLAAVAALIVLMARGAFRSDVFAGSPPRAVPLRLADLLAALAINFLLSAVLGGVLEVLRIPLDASTQAKPLQAWAMAKLALLSQCGTQLPVVYFFFLLLRRRRDGARRVGLIPRDPSKEILAASLALLAAILLPAAVGILMDGIGEVIGLPPPEVGHKMLKIMSESQSRGALAVLMVSAVVIAPLLEEIIFRGLVQTALLNALGRSRRWTVVLLAATLFMVVHIGSVPWQGLPALLTLGIILGWLYEKYGSLLPCVLVHAGFNALNTGFTLLFFSPQGVSRGI